MNSVIRSRFEHTLQTPFGLREEVERLCREARDEEFRAVVVPSSSVVQAYDLLEGAPVKVSSLIGFPLGWSDADAKRYEVDAAVDAGAHEIEYIPSLARIKEQQYREVLRELRDAASACDERPLKILVEASLWTTDELKEIVRLVLDSGAQFISTGLISRLNMITEIRDMAGPDFGIKCDLPSIETAEAALESGADLLSLPGPARAGGQKSQGFGI